MSSVFVYEYLSAGGEVDPGPLHPELIGQGRAMRDALVADLLSCGSIDVTAAHSHRAPPMASLRERARWVQPRADEDPRDFVRAQAARHDTVIVVAPESGGWLANFAAVVAPHAWAGCSLESIECAGSKSATARCLRGAGLAVPRQWVPGMPRDTAASAWVVKPDDGAGAVDTHRFDDFEEACREYLARTGAGESVVLESWIDGLPLSLGLMVRPGVRANVELLAINRQHFELAGHALRYLGVSPNVMPLNDERARQLALIAQRIGDTLPGLSGYVGVDLVWHPQRGPVVIEVNPRPTCAYVGLSQLLGRNLGREILDAHAARWPVY